MIFPVSGLFSGHQLLFSQLLTSHAIFTFLVVIFFTPCPRSSRNRSSSLTVQTDRSISFSPVTRINFFCGNLFIYIHGMYSVFSAGSADFVCRLFKKKILFLFLINIRKIFLDVPEHFHISPDTGFCHRNRTDTSGIKDLLCLQSGYQGQLTNRHFQPTLFQICS